MDTVKKCLLNIHTTRKIGMVTVQALAGFPILLVVLYILAGFCIKFQIGNLQMLPIYEIIYSRSYYISTIAFIALRILWIDTMNKKTTYELMNDQLIVIDRFLNDERRTLSLVNAGEVYQTATLFQKLFGVGDIFVSYNDPKNGAPMILSNIEDPDNAFNQISAQVAYMKNNFKISEARSIAA